MEFTSNGTETTDNNAAPVEDFLDEDKPISGQSYCCLSFLSPEKVLQKKEVFFVKEFFNYLNLPDIENLENKYDDFIALKEQEITSKFKDVVGGSTCVRGLKVRGVYDTRKEADVRAQVLQRLDRSHHVYVAQVGYWLPWDPNPDNVQESEYLEKELNTLMKQYKSNEVQRDMFYAEEVREYKNNAAKDNAAKENTESKSTDVKIVDSETVTEETPQEN
jgi:hypothetical protein